MCLYIVRAAYTHILPITEECYHIVDSASASASETHTQATSIDK